MKKVLLAAGTICLFVLVGAAGMSIVSENEEWRAGVQVVSTILTMLICSSYFLIPKRSVKTWYRILMGWAAVLMFSYILSIVIPGTKPYNMGTERLAKFLPWFLVPIALLAFPIWLIFVVFYLMFAREALYPDAELKITRRPVLILLASIGIIFGFLNGLQVLPGEWGPLGLNETAIFGMVYGFLILLKPPKQINLLMALVMGFFLLAYVMQPPGMDTGFGYALGFLWGEPFNLGALTDVMIALVFFPASIMLIRRARRW